MYQLFKQVHDDQPWFTRDTYSFGEAASLKSECAQCLHKYAHSKDPTIDLNLIKDSGDLLILRRNIQQLTVQTRHKLRRSNGTWHVQFKGWMAAAQVKITPTGI